MSLRHIESTLPAGFRFCPSDEELMCYYLQKKVANESSSRGTMVEVDLHTHEPWQLPEAAKLNEKEWYFFSFRDRKYARGWRSNRATKSGYWKTTGKDRVVSDPKSHEVVGTRKTLVFYQGRAPKGRKTNWVMHEFRLGMLHAPPKEDWVLCRVFHKKRGMENEQENIHNPSCSTPPPLPPDQHMPTDHSIRVLCHEQTTTTTSPAFPIDLPVLQEGNFLDLAWLRHHFIEDSTGLLLDVGLDGDKELDDHEMVVQRLGGIMDDNFGACSTGLGVRGGNNYNVDQFIFP
ncbi:protein CUP-SHAPED COTYLEDON 1-like [Zingiber officinale]|uniref:NAC domain-containing protein n=1 Tax=Zingiber officinale TaxID=94328 RepID=A0A8J5BWG0_ZINOF|nr:protein CUP-SHAPED COTYLEDON 1-like [Zingiber officinale]KAG6467513.1 hypothetical protein ZIOFF_074643 [Zingiber officinale]